MKNWMKEHKVSILLSMAVTLLPMLIGLLLWNRLPDSMTTHWGADGVADGFSGKAFAVFGLPAILAALNLLCLILTALDPKQKNQNRKALGMVFWIMPLISLAACGTVYATALGKTMDVGLFMPLVLGALFIILGNYLPKVKQNSTLGIKISWTLNNEENWNLTHRFTGKLWVAGGILALLMALLPLSWVIPVLLIDILVLSFAPMAYSYRIYKNHKAQGIEYSVPPKTKSPKINRILVIVLVAAIFACVAAVMFTGDITYSCTDSTLRIETNYVNGLELPYKDIDSIELREDFDIGIRAMGFGSPRLSMGAFQNEEFEAYTLYSYNSCDRVILIRSDNKVLVINCQTEEETAVLYQTLVAKIG